jgi:hypothetical protein
VLEKPVHQSVAGQTCAAPVATGELKAGGISDVFSATGGSVEQAATASPDTAKAADRNSTFMERLTHVTARVGRTLR